MNTRNLKICGVALIAVLSILTCAVSAETIGGNEGWFQFNSNVDGATVYVDGKAVGTTPHTMVVYSTGTPYSSAYVSKSGYHDSSTKALSMPSAGQTNTYYFTLQQITPPTPVPSPTQISVTSNPSGAKLYIDGIYYGRTPQTEKGFSPGQHTVRLEKDDYESWTGYAHVTTGQTTYISASLIHRPTDGTISVTTTPNGAHIYIDGTYMGESPKVIGGISRGSHHVELEKAGYNDWTGRVTVSSGQVTYIDQRLVKNTQPTTGSVAVTSSPSWAYVYLDNVYQGQTTPGGSYVINNVVAGTHTLRLTLSGYSDSETSVTVNSGQRSVVSSVLTPGGSHPAPGAHGSIDVTSSPTGATVYVNNVNKGITPVTVSDLGTGSYTVLLQLNGYQDWSTTATVSSGGVSSVSATLSPTAAPTKSGALPIPALGAVVIAGFALIMLRTGKE
ncbi:MAG: PEGA domain-containing protein [Euryarchaeota archaeon]|nr:PEGA domain-containing protein [Euryarchaeota archaeon]